MAGAADGQRQIRRGQDAAAAGHRRLRSLPWLSQLGRRRLAGFPAPHEYLVQNRRRRAATGDSRGPVFPDPDWHWLAMFEPEINIPLRSVFMLEFAVERARCSEPVRSRFRGRHSQFGHGMAGGLRRDAGSRVMALARARVRPSRFRFALASLARGVHPIVALCRPLRAWLLR